MRRVGPLLALALLLASGCSQRARLNPFDPGNPITGGRPANFVALAGDQVVTLRWDRASASGLLGYELFRRRAGETDFVALTGLIPVSTTTAGDFGLQNGAEHDYRLYFVFEDGPRGQPAEDTATPGPLRPWVALFSRPALARLTPDARHVAFEYGALQGPTQVAVDPGSGKVWVSDTEGARVVVFDPATSGVVSIADVSAPGALDVDPLDGTAWVCDADLNAVRHFTPAGGFATPGQITPLSTPLDVAVDLRDRSLWVCERTANRVRRFDATGAAIGSEILDAPSRVALDSLTREAWVTSFEQGRVVRLSATSTQRDTVGGLAGPIGVAVDWRRGRIWVADALGDQVVALRRDGTVEFRIPGLFEVREIAVDLASGEAWATVPGAGAVARLSPAGTVNGRITGLLDPDGIALWTRP